MINDSLPLKHLKKSQDIISAHLPYRLNTVCEVPSCLLFHLHNTPMECSHFTSEDAKSPEKVSNFPKVAQPIGNKTVKVLTLKSSDLSTT